MASRNATDIEAIKDRLDLQDYIGRDVKQERAGDHVKVCCPFHGEKTASMHVWDDHFKCFGCSRGGDIFAYYQEKNNVDFKTALVELAREAGISLHDDPDAKARYEKHQSTVSLYRAVAELYHAALTVEAREYLHSRSYTDAFINEYLIGLAKGNGHVRQVPGFSLAQLQEAELINEAGRDVLWGRITFPIWGRYDGEVIGLAGRMWPKTDAEPKYMSVPGGPAPLLNERGLRSPKGRRSDGSRYVFLVEGDTDTATLVQHERPVVGVRGANGLQDNFKTLFERIDTVFICGDGDKAGLDLIKKAGGLFGNKVRVVVYPSDEDTSSYVSKYGVDALDALSHQAQPYVRWMLDRLPADIQPEDIDRHVGEFAKALINTQPGSQEAYIKQINKRLGIPQGPIKQVLREMVAQTTVNGVGSNGHSTETVADGEIIWEDTPSINPVQALVDGVMHTVVFLDKTSIGPDDVPRIEARPHVITSSKEFFELTDAEMHKRNLRYSKTKVPAASIVQKRWSVSANRSYSVKSYIDGTVNVNPAEIYDEVIGYFKRFLHYPVPEYHDFLACWVIGTYFFAIFPSYPYVHLTGAKRAGKTTTIDIVSGLAFNAVMSASMTGASVYRTIEMCSPTLLMDEAENLQKKGAKDAEADGDKLEILKAGYKAGAVAVRCVGDDHQPTGFDVYSPKMFGSVGAVDRILADRMVSLILERKPPGIKVDEFRESEVRASFDNTRDKIYCLMMEHAHEVQDRLREGIGWAGVRDRDRELWTPILIIARMIDEYVAAERGPVDVDDLITTRLRRMATGSVKDRVARDKLGDSNVIILNGVLEYIESHNPWSGTDWYQGQTMLEWIQTNVEGASQRWPVVTRHIYDVLEQLRVIEKKSDLGPRKNPNGKNAKCVRIDKAKVHEIYATQTNGED